jgi:cytochrome d ubiquinol oxidase subunit II
VDKLRYDQAASSPESLFIMFIGVAITLPAILFYTGYSYKVFWGKATDLSYD